ncbi:MAG: type II secretion system protein [Acidimicrobiales bacterium]
MLNRYRRNRRTDADRFGHGGFTLIELLIVIIIMGILAAVVVFALGGVTGTSAVAACNTDAKTVEVGVQAYYAQNDAYPTTIAELDAGTNAALRSWPSNNSYYFVGLGTAAGGVLWIDTTGHTATVAPLDASLQGPAPTAGSVWVEPVKVTTGVGVTATDWYNYDTFASTATPSTNICGAVS